MKMKIIIAALICLFIYQPADRTFSQQPKIEPVPLNNSVLKEALDIKADSIIKQALENKRIVDSRYLKRVRYRTKATVIHDTIYECPNMPINPNDYFDDPDSVLVIRDTIWLQMPSTHKKNFLQRLFNN